MKMIITVVTMTALGTVFSGCSHGTHEVDGVQARDEIPEGIRVRIGGTEVTDGDKVDVFRTSCRTYSSPKNGSEKCKSIKIGSALVLKVLDHDSAIVQPEDGLVMDSSMTVEKRQN